MNRSGFIFALLLMFIGCGNNSTTGVIQIPVKKDSTEPSFIAEELSGMQRFVSVKLDSLFGGLYHMKAFNGSVLVARNGNILYKRTFGLCDKKQQCLLNDSSMFQLASVSKVITATSVLMLMERGLIDIEKPVCDYLYDFPYEKVTVKQLLTHRSGLFNYLYALHSELYRPGYKMSNTDMYELIKERRPAVYLRPNRRFNYCNTNYALLALLVEKVSGKRFNEFLRTEIFEPLGMKHTKTIADIDINAYNITKPYDDRWKSVEFDASDYVLGDKSVYSTAYDLFLFSEALYNNKLIKEETQKLAYAPYSKERRLSNYGLGWRIKDFRDPDKKEVYHNGWWHGYRSSFHRRLKDSLTVIILSNQLNKAAYQTGMVYQVLDSTSENLPSADEGEE